MNRMTQMRCPKCGYAYSKARSSKRCADSSMRRDRICLKCEGTFATYEITAGDYRVLAALRKWHADDNRKITLPSENAA